MTDQGQALKRLHKVLIGFGIGLGIGFTAYSVAHEQMLSAGLTALFTVSLGIYFRWFLKKQ